jgi:hypothetical protein
MQPVSNFYLTIIIAGILSGRISSLVFLARRPAAAAEIDGAIDSSPENAPEGSNRPAVDKLGLPPFHA